MVREMVRLTTPAVCDGEAQVQEMAREMARGDEVDPSSRSDHRQTHGVHGSGAIQAQALLRR
jgi:hypothetical protein